ncbi:helix-turn-helix transcriptional regulator [Actinoallomurus sp. NPDC052308]|uniref:helix-turn-helix domain-containing protein n=1 Tax=Actinoallomurus sp. NPDC052308 TaxID=3155530 RepID=UPI003423541A
MSVFADQPSSCPTIPSMSDPRRSPTLRRRRLSATLRELRARDGRTAKEIAEELEWQQSKLTHMERNEWKLPRVLDIRALLEVYGVTDEREREELINLARDGRKRGWWHPYSAMLSEHYSTYIGLEAEASEVFAFETIVIPGLLQTEDYARALIEAGPAEITEEEVERRVQIRIERQRILTGDDPVRLWAILDEAALRRPVGGAEVMEAQKRHLVKMAKLAKVSLQVIPFGAGAHAGAAGAFSIIRFPESRDTDAVYVDTPAGELFVEDEEEVRRFHVAFQHLSGVALSPLDSIALIAAEVGGT